MRLQFERGEITLYEWIPVRMNLHGLFKKGQLKTLQKMLGSFSIVMHNNTDQGNKKVKGKFSEIIFDDHVTRMRKQLRKAESLPANAYRYVA